MSVNIARLCGFDARRIHIRPWSDEKVTVKECGNITDVTYCEKRSYGGVTKKLDKNTYLDTRNGEVKEFKHHDTRLDDTKSVKRSLRDGRDMINANIVDVSKWRMITLTYAENMTDHKKLYEDFKNFWHKKFRVAFPTADRYITANEPQGRGAWHVHLLVGFSDVAPFIPNDVVHNLWGHGFVKVTAIDSVDNVGAYLSAYLSDLPIEDAKRLKLSKNGDTVSVLMPDSDGKPIKKKVVKGARMVLYPAGMHIFRWSRNCTKPIIERCTEKVASERVEGQRLIYEDTTIIQDANSGWVNVVNKRTYNKILKEAKSDNN